MNYINNLNEEVKQYFSFLCDNDYPEFINKYIDTKELQRLSRIGQFCGCDYTKLYNVKYWYSKLDHSIACALMIWHFTHDKIKTLIALFNNLGTPAFSHCVDFLLKDSLHQKSSTKPIYEILENNNKLSKLLLSDNIQIDDFKNKENYNLLENDSPKLCTDRLEGIFSACLVWLQYFKLEDIKRIYRNLKLLKNEDDELEIGIQNKVEGELFFNGIYEYSIALQADENKYVLQYIANYIDYLLDNQLLVLNYFYTMDESTIVDIIKLIDNGSWERFEKTNHINRTNEPIKGEYCISVDTKKRYTIPLCEENKEAVRINEISGSSDYLLKKCLNYYDNKYAYMKSIKYPGRR